MDLKELIGLRKNRKSKKPDFVRQDAHKKRLKKKWLKPRGLQSKVRLKKASRAKRISSGYRAPKEVRGLHTTGLKEVIVASLKDIEGIKKETQGAVIKSGVGSKKKSEIIKKLKELQIKILNVKDADKYLKQVEEKLKSRKDKRSKLKAKKDKKKEEKKPAKKEEKLSDKVITEEDKKKEEKKEKDKVLTKKK